MIVAISGKINSGKDTVGNIIQILIDNPHFTNEAVIKFLDIPAKYSYINMKFADSLKDIVCIMLGCTREQLEDREFKEKELRKEWGLIYNVCLNTNESEILYTFTTSVEAANKSSEIDNLFNYNDLTYVDTVKMTPRLLLQLLGTQCGRNILHPNVWINSLMSKYQIKKYSIGINKIGHQTIIDKYPNWIITDLRFTNELKAIKDREGISIRVNRKPFYKYLYQDGVFTFEEVSELVYKDTGEYPSKDYANKHWIVKEHESETALDNTTFDVTIDNNATLSDLVDKCRDIIKEFQLK